MVRSPVGFVKSPAFLMVWAIDAATYSTTNYLKTCTEHRDMFDDDDTDDKRTNRRQFN